MSYLIPLTGEPLALDLVNTHPVAGDLLVTPADLSSWLVLQSERFGEAAELADTEPGVDGLEAVRNVRDHVAHALDRVRRGERPSADDLDALNRAQRLAPAVLELAWGGTAVTATRRRTGTPAEQLAAWLAEACAEFLAGPLVTKVRQCEADGCVMLFVPAHPRRRWCSATRCGNRVRVARHYQRHKPA
ncbi:putative RNA-binding Zn ribbon-like protein [Pseudonocardia hierapolitana]|uniref:Putative RNA-binding Zn ribbon-like protein n=1 Tax=Pseudonocardia hierapolitana TaxID=1128676 RepID=A0A561SRZ5_9PSEU|nr:ABATE domain-containing protein [Pseudonocardia hierapolitana]TWF77639.1 putative RNA-binding Zn ribbon-like protein [Pseudonocardia hierapolitana]